MRGRWSGVHGFGITDIKIEGGAKGNPPTMGLGQG